MPSTKQTLSARTVAVELLAASGGPRKVKELITEALADPRSHKIKGKTPEATVAARLYTAAKNGKPVTTLDGTEGVLVKADRGTRAFKRSRARQSR
jgi:hypothetical protein